MSRTATTKNLPVCLVTCCDHLRHACLAHFYSFRYSDRGDTCPHQIRSARMTPGVWPYWAAGPWYSRLGIHYCRHLRPCFGWTRVDPSVFGWLRVDHSVFLSGPPHREGDWLCKDPGISLGLMCTRKTDRHHHWLWEGADNRHWF